MILIKKLLLILLTKKELNNIMITISQVPVGATVQIDGEKFQYSGQAMLKFKGMKTLTFGKVGDKYIMVVGKSIEYD